MTLLTLETGSEKLILDYTPLEHNQVGINAAEYYGGILHEQKEFTPSTRPVVPSYQLDSKLEQFDELYKICFFKA